MDRHFWSRKKRYNPQFCDCNSSSQFYLSNIDWHILIVDRNTKNLYVLSSIWYDGLVNLMSNLDLKKKNNSWNKHLKRLFQVFKTQETE